MSYSATIILTPQSDLGVLMQKAVDDYNSDTKDLEKDPNAKAMQAKSMEDVQKYIKTHTNNFKNYRHPGGIADRLTTTIGNHLGAIQAMSNALGAATTQFFPAAAPVFTAVNFLIFTGNRVGSDFDNLEDFFEDVGACMNSISIVEGSIHTSRKNEKLDEAFKKVFSAVLTLCAVSTRFIKDGRLKRGLLRGLLNDDRGLSVAYIKLQKTMANLGASIQNGTFVGVVQIEAGMELLQDQVMVLEKLANEGLATAKEGLTVGNQTLAVGKEVLGVVQRLEDAVKEQGLANPGRIRVFFKGFASSKAEFDDRRKRLLSDTAEWILKDEVYKNWFDKEDTSWGQPQLSFLWVCGGMQGTGSGKSMLAYKVVDRLNTYATTYREMSVAYFFFPQDKKISLRAALFSLIIQAADFDEVYCKKVVDMIKESKGPECEMNDNLEIWQKYIADHYQSGKSRGKLYIVLDGIDEVVSDDQKGDKVLQDVQEIVKKITSEKLNIKLLLLGRDNIKEKFAKVGDVDVPQIDVLPEKIEGDVKLFIDDRVGKVNVFLDDEVLQKIKDVIWENTKLGGGGFAYANSFMDEINTKDQVEDIQEVLDHPPDGGVSGFAKLVLDRVLKKLPAGNEERMKTIRILIYWSALGFNYFTIRELSCVIALSTGQKQFDLIVAVRKTCEELLKLEVDDQDAAHEHDTAVSAITGKPSRRHPNEVFSRSTVKFRDFRFEGSFLNLEWTTETAKTNGLVENAYIAQLEMTLLTIKVVSWLPSDPGYESSRDLETYSVNSWDTHLANLDDYFDKPTDDEVTRVIKGLKGLFTNPESTSVALEENDVKMYESFISAKVLTEEIPDEEKGRMLRWCLKAKKLGAERLGLSLEDWEWVEKVIAFPPSLLTPLAEEHVQHWLKQTDITSSFNKFEFAFSAYKATGLITLDSKSTVSEVAIVEIFEKCTGLEIGEDAYRAVGSTLSHYDFNDKAIEYFEKAQAHSKTTRGKFVTLVGLGRAYFLTGRYAEAQESLSAALLHEEEMLSDQEQVVLTKKLLRIAYKFFGRSLLGPYLKKPKGWSERDAYMSLGKTLMPDKCVGPGISKEDAQKAIHAFEQAILLLPDDDFVTLNTSLLDSIYWTLIRCTKDNNAIIDKVSAWNRKIFATWLLEDLEYEAGEQVDLQSAAKKAGRLDDLVKCYQAAIATTDKEGDSLMMQVELYSLYWKVQEDEDLAYKHLRELMDTEDSSRNGKVARHRANILLSEMMYGRIKALPPVWVKRLLAADLAVVSNKDTESALDVWNIRPNVSLAAAYIACKQHAEAVSLLDPAFNLCIEWLTDDVEDNDSSSLRLLARLLACVGLEKDASITCSAQSSIISKQTPEPAADAKTEAELEIKTITAGPEISSETKVPAKIPHTEDPISLEELDRAIHMLSAAKMPDDDPEESPDDATFDRLIPADQEDIRWGTPSCDGCSKSFRYWVKDEPFYMCLTCYNMDLCKECHAKRVALDGQAAGGETTKLTFCGENHDYVKAPVDGWGGIKDGILSIGHEKFEFTHWLGDVKEKWEDWKDKGIVVG